MNCCDMDIWKNRVVVHSATRRSIPIQGRGAHHCAYHGGVMVPPCWCYGGLEDFQVGFHWVCGRYTVREVTCVGTLHCSVRCIWGDKVLQCTHGDRDCIYLGSSLPYTALIWDLSVKSWGVVSTLRLCIGTIPRAVCITETLQITKMITIVVDPFARHYS